MALSDIPTRVNGQDIDASWFNTIKTNAISDIAVASGDRPLLTSGYNVSSVSFTDVTNMELDTSNPNIVHGGEIKIVLRDQTNVETMWITLQVVASPSWVILSDDRVVTGSSTAVDNVQFQFREVSTGNSFLQARTTATTLAGTFVFKGYSFL